MTRVLSCSECGAIPERGSLGEICTCGIGFYRLVPESDPGDTSLLGRMRFKIEHATAHRLTAIAVDIGDLNALVLGVSRTRCKGVPANERPDGKVRDRAKDFHPAERALHDCEQRLAEARSQLSQAGIP